MKPLNSLNWSTLLGMGLLSGIVILYMGIIGMIASFHEREIIDDLITLGQLTLLLTPFLASYYVATRLSHDGVNKPIVAISGIMIGVLTAVPTIIMLLYNSDDYRFLLDFTLFAVPFIFATYAAKTVYDTNPNTSYVIGVWSLVAVLTAVVTGSLYLIFDNVGDIDGFLTHIDRDWVEVVTFDNRNDLAKGIFELLKVSVGAGFIGSIFYVYPEEPRLALSYGLFVTLIVAVFGETVRLVLQEHFDRETLSGVFQRDTLKQTPAIILFLFSTVVGFHWILLGQQAKDRYQSLDENQQSSTKLLGYAILAVVLLALPWLIGRTLSDVSVTIGLFVLMGLGLNIAIGLAGLLDLGYVTNYAVGAYVLAVLTSIGPLGIGNGNFTFWMVIPIALLSAMAAGFIFAVPVLRMRGDYLAIATLGFGEIIGKLAISDWFSGLIGGAQGVQSIPKPVLSLNMKLANMVDFNYYQELKDPEQLYYVVFAACLVTLFVSVRLNNSRIGRQWMAIREDEDVASAMGIDTARAKLLAFTLSAATGGVAGAIFAAKVGTVFPNSFTVFVSLNVLSLIIIGGIASNPGIVVGAIVLIGMPELLREFSEFRFLIYGILLIVTMINRPQGLIPSQVRARELAIRSGAGD